VFLALFSFFGCFEKSNPPPESQSQTLPERIDRDADPLPLPPVAALDPVKTFVTPPDRQHQVSVIGLPADAVGGAPVTAVNTRTGARASAIAQSNGSFVITGMAAEV